MIRQGLPTLLACRAVEGNHAGVGVARHDARLAREPPLYLHGAQQSAAFVQNPEVHQLLSTQGTNCLPLIAVDGHIVSRRGYPAREMLALWTASDQKTAEQPGANSTGGCCGGSAAKSTDACCVADEQAKADGKVGCGCDDSGCC